MASTGSDPSPFTRIRKVTLSFRLPYFTQWGQNLMVCGSDPALGAWKTKQGLRMTPRLQAADVLFWHATLTVPHDFSCNYSYYVVDDQKNVLRLESGKRHAFVLPHGLPDAASVEIYDLWQVLLLLLFLPFVVLLNWKIIFLTLLLG
jgi:4-alpha-glucanotransferase